ncbi:hypothetical protein SBRY_50363 [Actinacidiphila bryophytorum]|uniref:Uncharacterized protein n=1 Tax=Actinacidiphila bryophytorum TaxID=1436133 RepID=A0A9W4MD70_9ACTN|nr:hypothetical protein SBRY_50363 [Actinacidiphila bryophytorum]
MPDLGRHGRRRGRSHPRADALLGRAGVGGAVVVAVLLPVQLGFDGEREPAGAAVAGRARAAGQPAGRAERPGHRRGRGRRRRAGGGGRQGDGGRAGDAGAAPGAVRPPRGGRPRRLRTGCRRLPAVIIL